MRQDRKAQSRSPKLCSDVSCPLAARRLRRLSRARIAGATQPPRPHGNNELGQNPPAVSIGKRSLFPDFSQVSGETTWRLYVRVRFIARQFATAKFVHRGMCALINKLSLHQRFFAKTLEGKIRRWVHPPVAIEPHEPRLPQVRPGNPTMAAQRFTVAFALPLFFAEHRSFGDQHGRGRVAQCGRRGSRSITGRVQSGRWADHHPVGPDAFGKIDDHPCRVPAPHHSA
jgi:hypothetical protein